RGPWHSAPAPQVRPRRRGPGGARPSGAAWLVPSESAKHADRQAHAGHVRLGVRSCEAADRGEAMKLRFVPLTTERWNDFAGLFGPRGASSGCWCMWWILERKDYRAGQGVTNKRRMKKRVEKGPPPGLLAYAGKRAVGWVALAPRSEYSGLARARSLKPVDDQPVWSVPCFFVAKEFRRSGMTSALLEAAAAYARKQGARIL